MWQGLAIPVAAGIIYLLVWYGPDLIAMHDVGPISGPPLAMQLQQARDAARGRLLTLGAGLFAAGALVYTRLNYRLSREGQVTDRYTKAVEQLGSDRLDVRIGGIYALERVARDSAKDHPTVMEVLAAFIREHSREKWPPGADDQSGADGSVHATRPDVQAAVTVIGRRDPRHDRQAVNLSGADLSRADLSGADLSGAYLSSADLDHANFAEAKLAHARLFAASLTGANLAGADLTSGEFSDAILIRAHLKDANLTDANLTGADLTNADFFGADLTRAYLVNADLTGVDLDRAILHGANLTGAKWAKDKPAPAGWARDPASACSRAL